MAIFDPEKNRAAYFAAIKAKLGAEKSPAASPDQVPPEVVRKPDEVIPGPGRTSGGPAVFRSPSFPPVDVDPSVSSPGSPEPVPQVHDVPEPDLSAFFPPDVSSARTVPSAPDIHRTPDAGPLPLDVTQILPPPPVDTPPNVMSALQREVDDLRGKYFKAKQEVDNLGIIDKMLGGLGKHKAKVDGLKTECATAESKYKLKRAEFLAAKAENLLYEQTKIFEEQIKARLAKTENSSKYVKGAKHLGKEAVRLYKKSAELNLEKCFSPRGLEILDKATIPAFKINVWDFLPKIGGKEINIGKIHVGRGVFRALSVRTGISASLLAAGWFAGSGVAVGKAALWGRRLLAGTSSIGYNDMLSMGAQALDRKKIDGDLTRYESGQDTPYYKDVAFELSQIRNSGLLSGKTAEQVVNDPLYKRAEVIYAQLLQQRRQDFDTRGLNAEAVSKMDEIALGRIGEDADKDLKKRKWYKAGRMAAAVGMGLFMAKRVRGQEARGGEKSTDHPAQATTGGSAEAQKHIQELQNQLNEQTGKVGQLNKALQEANNKSATLEQKIHDLQQQLETKGGGTDKHLEELQKQLTDSQKAVERLHSELAQEKVQIVDLEHKLGAGQPEAKPADATAAKPDETAKPGPNVAHQASASESGIKVPGEMPKDAIKLPGKDAWVEADGGIHVGTRGIEGALLDLRKAQPDKYKAMVEWLKNQEDLVRKTPSANTDGHLIHRYILTYAHENDYSVGDGGPKDLSRILQGGIKIGADGQISIEPKGLAFMSAVHERAASTVGSVEAGPHSALTGDFHNSQPVQGLRFDQPIPEPKPNFGQVNFYDQSLPPDAVHQSVLQGASESARQQAANTPLITPDNFAPHDEFGQPIPANRLANHAARTIGTAAEARPAQALVYGGRNFSGGGGGGGGGGVHHVTPKPVDSHLQPRPGKVPVGSKAAEAAPKTQEDRVKELMEQTKKEAAESREKINAMGRTQEALNRDAGGGSKSVEHLINEALKVSSTAKALKKVLGKSYNAFLQKFDISPQDLDGNGVSKMTIGDFYEKYQGSGQFAGVGKFIDQAIAQKQDDYLRSDEFADGITVKEFLLRFSRDYMKNN